MKAEELRQKTDSELRELSKELRRQLWQAKFSNYGLQLNDTSKIRALRRDQARVLTLLAESARKSVGEVAK
jgi:large subunit ribosomal protein L29